MVESIFCKDQIGLFYALLCTNCWSLQTKVGGFISTQSMKIASKRSQKDKLKDIKRNKTLQITQPRKRVRGLRAGQGGIEHVLQQGSYELDCLLRHSIG